MLAVGAWPVATGRHGAGQARQDGGWDDLQGRRRQAAAALCEARVHTPGQAWPLAGGAQGAGGCAPADAAAKSAVHFLSVQDG